MCALTKSSGVVLDTTKVQIFKQITTRGNKYTVCVRCFRYHKGTDFQANHNCYSFLIEEQLLFQIPQRYRFSSKSQRFGISLNRLICCFRYHKGTDFQANHNVVILLIQNVRLFQIPQRYRFSSKSQLSSTWVILQRSCFRYHKGTDFQANHNRFFFYETASYVVLDTTKVQIFKQITTTKGALKSSQCCFRYHKGTDFQANHNQVNQKNFGMNVVLDTTKVQIFKQITTNKGHVIMLTLLFQIPQRYRFSSKSQRIWKKYKTSTVVLDTTKVQIFKQITTWRYRLRLF